MTDTIPDSDLPPTAGTAEDDAEYGSEDGDAGPELDPDSRLSEPGRVREAGEFVALLAELLKAFSPDKSVSLKGNFFFGQANVREAIAGSRYSGSAASGFSGWLSSGQVPGDVLLEVRATFVPPDRYQALRRRLEDGFLLLLRAPAGWGRTATALHMLQDLCPTGVWKFNPEVRLDLLKTEELRAGAGYLIESLEFEQAARLRPFHLQALAAELQDRRCRLVILLDTTAPVREEVVMESVPEAWPSPADPLAVVRRHLAFRLDGEPGARDPDFLARADARELLQEVTASAPGLRRLAEFAASLADAVRGNVELDAVGARFAAGWTADLRGWFDDKLDTEQRAHVIALAVLNGMPVTMVRRAAGLLAEAIRVAEAQYASPTRTVFGPGRLDWLVDNWAETFDVAEMTAYGQTITRAVRFRDERFALSVLEHVWTRYDEAQELIIGWLRGLAADEDRRIQVHAGGTAGVLSLFDFDLVRRDLLLPWAESGRPHEQEATVGALALPSRHAQLAPLVSRMIADWSQPHRSPRMRWTAARALGASAGSTMPGRALRLLALAADSDDKMLTAAVCDSVAELFAYGEAGLEGMVLSTLLSWTDDRRPRRRVGILCFLQLGNDITLEAPAGGSAPWPALIWLARQDEGRFAQVVTLLRRTLDTPHLFRPGYKLLYAWIRTAERDTTLREPLIRMIIALAADKHDTESLSYYLDRWSQEKNAPASFLLILRENLKRIEI